MTNEQWAAAAKAVDARLPAPDAVNPGYSVELGDGTLVRLISVELAWHAVKAAGAN